MSEIYGEVSTDQYEYDEGQAELGEERSGIIFSEVTSTVPSDSNLLVDESAESSTLLGNASSKDLGKKHPSYYKAKKLDSTITPFYIQWSFGINIKVPVFNLTRPKRTVVFYAASHNGILFDYTKKKMRVLQGHKNAVSSLSADDTGQWLTSCDSGPDNTIIVWDSTEGKSIFTIFNPHPEVGVAVVGLSGNAKYLVSVGNEPKPIVRFWKWTFGEETPNDSQTLKGELGRALKIGFNENVQEHIMIVFEKQAVFITWDDESNKLRPAVMPKVRHRKSVGTITDGTFVGKCHECFVSTTEGCVLVFGNSFHAMSYEEASLDNNKLFVNTIKVTKTPITCITSVDELIATGDFLGHIKFYDKRMRILFWCHHFELKPLKCVSFHLQHKTYKLIDPYELIEEDYCLPQNWLEEDYEDVSEENELIFARDLPSDATLEHDPFIIRDFIIATEDGRIALVDYVNNRCDFFFNRCDSAIVAIDTHKERPFVCVAYANGRLCVYNFHNHSLLVDYRLPKAIDEETEELIRTTTIAYSPESLHLVCGRSNGDVWILEPSILRPKQEKPLHASLGSIIKIVFSSDSRYFAYADVNYTVCLYKYVHDEDIWVLLGKLRSHYKDIKDILFSPYLPSRLFTIGEDRIIAEYDIEKSGDGQLVVVSRERTDQTPIPRCCIYYPKSDQSKTYNFLTTDNQFKYKIINDKTYMCRSVALGPAYGCYADDPVDKLKILPNHNDEYMVFANNKHVGLQLLPLDGNPYKYIGVIGHPKQLIDFRVSADGKYLFTFGADDSCLLMWYINVTSVKTLLKIGGTALEPYYPLIEGGINGWLFKEMQDLFYYMQILHQGENTNLPRKVSDRIPNAELPDLMRACGFYPTEYEIENMIIDVKYRKYDETGELNDSTSFFDFVCLYINYKPPHGIPTQSLRHAFDNFCQTAVEPEYGIINRDEFVDSLCCQGEVFTLGNAKTCLSILMNEEVVEDEEENFNFLPEEITFETFLEDILGIDMDRQIDEDSGSPGVREEEFDENC